MSINKPVRARDGQQWIYDYLMRTTGRAIHFEIDGRQLPSPVKSIKMAAKYLSKKAEKAEKLASLSKSNGDLISARILYRKASEMFREAQHFTVPIISDYRWGLYEKCLSCTEELHKLSEYKIKKVYLESEIGPIPALWHIFDTEVEAPAVVFIPGMDNTKENYPNPLENEFHMRGMHVLAIDGPGQGEMLREGVYVTQNNHIIAAKAAYEFLAKQKTVDEKKIGICGRSFGTFWSMRAAAAEPRFAALAGAVACYFWDNLNIFDEAPIRFKQIFMEMAGTHSEEQFDLMCQDFSLKPDVEKISCPTLMATGEFDPLSPLEDADAIFSKLNAPKEMWVFEDEFHPIRTPEALSGHSVFHYIAHWMRKALDGKLPSKYEKRRYISKNGDGMFG